MPVDVDRYYRRYGPMVFRRCNAILRNEELALDVMQDVFVRVLRAHERLDGTAPSSLLYTIATNLSLNALRSRARRRESDWIGDDDSDPEIPFFDRGHDGVLTRHFLDRLFAEHDETTRTIAWLHYVDGMTLEQTAKQVGRSVSGVRKKLRKLQARGRALREA